MSSRPKGFGLTAELQRKKDGKYDPELAAQAIQWIEAVIDEELGDASSSDTIHACLKDGQILLKLAKALGENKYKINTSKLAFKQAKSTGKTTISLGAKEASANKREFTEEQLKSGQNVIGLQMGSNKGASQAGDHYGRPRQVAGANVYK